jgi:hypothetical protein
MASKRFFRGILMMLAAAAALPHAGGAGIFKCGLDHSSYFCPAGMQRAPPLRLHGGMQEYDPLGIALFPTRQRRGMDMLLVVKKARLKTALCTTHAYKNHHL